MRVYYGVEFVTVVYVMCVVLWAADEDVSMVTVIFYESESEQQRWNEVCARICYGKVGMRQEWINVLEEKVP